MGVLDSSYIKTIGVKSPGHKKIFFILSDTLIHMFKSLLFFLKISLKAFGEGDRRGYFFVGG